MDQRRKERPGEICFAFYPVRYFQIYSIVVSFAVISQGERNRQSIFTIRCQSFFPLNLSGFLGFVVINVTRIIAANANR